MASGSYTGWLAAAEKSHFGAQCAVPERVRGEFSLDFRRWLTDYKPHKIESDKTARRWESEQPNFLLSVIRVD